MSKLTITDYEKKIEQLKANKKYDDLLDIINSAIECFPQYNIFYYQRANLLLNQFNDNKSAIIDYKNFLKLSKSELYRLVTLNNLGQAYLKLNSLNNAIKYFDQALAIADINCSFLDALYANTAFCLTQIAKKEQNDQTKLKKAQNLYQKVLDIHPNHPEILARINEIKTLL